MPWARSSSGLAPGIVDGRPDQERRHEPTGERAAGAFLALFRHSVKKSRRLTKASTDNDTFSVQNDAAARVAAPARFKALGHPMRHQLLATLGRREATISQLAATLDSNKGNIAHHLRILVEAGLVEPAGTRQVRGGTEQYYRLTEGGPGAGDAADPRGFLTMRTLRLTPGHAEQLAAVLRDLAGQPEDADGQPHSMLVGLYQAEGTADAT
jgi:DNA-binding transcriptional ArsR family regulator